MGWLKRYQDGRRAALAEYGIGVGAPQPWPDDPQPQPEWNDDPSPIPPYDASAAQRVAELEAQLAGMQDELRAAREAHAEDDRLIDESRKLVDQYEAHMAELEALAEQLQIERDQLMEVLKLPGLKRLIDKEYSRERPEATDDVKRAFENYSKTINVAYDLIKQDAKAKKNDEAA